MKKAARLNHYATQLEEAGRPDLARRRYRMAIEATERVLADFPETEFHRDLRGEAAPEVEARLRIALAKFAMKSGRVEQARKELKRVLEANPEGPIASLTHFRIAETLEATSPREAIREYEACQPGASLNYEGFDFLDRIIDAASLNPATRQFFLEATGMSGRFNPAEAQARIIACHEELGERLQAEAAYKKLIDRYPFSEQSERLKKERGEPDAKTQLPVLPFLKNQPWVKKRPSQRKQPGEEPPEEKITIVPLE
jgi:tetratricopeptide (TPR) repeat protein